MTDQPRILIVTTSAADMGSKNEPTGLWLEELTTPYYALHDAGAQITVASIRGGRIPIDPRSLGEEAQKDRSVRRYHSDPVAQAAVSGSPALGSVDGSSYDAVFLPGGHGTMFDFPEDAELARLVAQTLQDGRIVAAVCHGPAGLVSALDENGDPVVKGRLVSAFADSEERAVGLAEKVPFLLEKRLRDLGAQYRKGPDFKPFAVEDRRLITGQNPASARVVAELLLEALRERLRSA